MPQPKSTHRGGTRPTLQRRRQHLVRRTEAQMILQERVVVVSLGDHLPQAVPANLVRINLMSRVDGLSLIRARATPRAGRVSLPSIPNMVCHSNTRASEPPAHFQAVVCASWFFATERDVVRGVICGLVAGRGLQPRNRLGKLLERRHSEADRAACPRPSSSTGTCLSVATCATSPSRSRKSSASWDSRRRWTSTTGVREALSALKSRQITDPTAGRYRNAAFIVPY